MHDYPTGITPDMLTRPHLSVLRSPIIADICHLAGLVEQGTASATFGCRGLTARDRAGRLQAENGIMRLLPEVTT